jgi:hypothetical protein
MTEVKRPDDPSGAYLYDASRVYAINQATKLARKWAIGAGLVSVYIAYEKGSRIGLLIGLLVGIAVFRLARYGWCRHMGIRGVPLVQDLLPASWRKRSAASPVISADAAALRDRYPRRARVPVLPGAPAISDVEVMRGTLRTSLVVHGGRAGTRVERLRMGAFKITDYGFAFLPNAQSMMEAKLGATEAAVAIELAGKMFGAVAMLDNLKDGVEALQDTPTLALWETEAIQQADAFVIPWPRLTAVHVGSDRTTFERARDDGGTDDFIVAEASIELPTLFMNRRLDHELVAVMRDRIWFPKVKQCFDENRAMLPAGTDPAIAMETAKAQVRDWLDANRKEHEAALRQMLAPVLASYRDLPVIVEQKPWLFEQES